MINVEPELEYVNLEFTPRLLNYLYHRNCVKSNYIDLKSQLTLKLSKYLICEL